MFEVSHQVDESKIDAAARLECSVCRWVYDPVEGDPTAHVSCCTPFSALPAQWRCPYCDAPKHKFMVLKE